MFTIHLIKFSKKRNSTAIPVLEGASANEKKTYTNCLIRTSASVSTPVIDIEEIANSNLYQYNYAYIPEFNRYYFVDDISYNIPFWTISLTVDVLASFRDDILDSREYVLRSASNYDSDLPDSFYPTLPSMSGTFQTQNYVSNTVKRYDSRDGEWWDAIFFNVTAENGAIVVGIVSSSTTGVTYYAFNVRSFNNFLSYVFNLVPSNMPSVDSGIAQALFNPIQYITTVRWFPTLPLITNTGGSRTTVNIGGEVVTLDPLDVCYVLNGKNVEDFKFSLSLPNHPDVANYSYRNLSPYAQYNLYFQPFGDIPLDSYKIYGSPGIEIKWSMDYTTGATAIKIYSQLGNKLVFSDMATLGVPIPISSLVYDTSTGLVLTGLQFLRGLNGDNISLPKFEINYGVSGATGGMSVESLAENIRKVAGIKDYKLKPLLPSFDNTDNATGLSSVMDAVGTSLGQVVTKGASSSFLAYNMGFPFIYAWFMKQTEVDVARFGRPLRQNVRLDNLSGFTICGNATVNFYGPQYPTDREHSRILAYLNRGFFIE